VHRNAGGDLAMIRGGQDGLITSFDESARHIMFGG
jgi:hypothetical protein